MEKGVGSKSCLDRSRGVSRGDVAYESLAAEMSDFGDMAAKTSI